MDRSKSEVGKTLVFSQSHTLNLIILWSCIKMRFSKILPK